MNTLLGQVTHTPYQVQSFTVFDPPDDLSLFSSSRNITINSIALPSNPLTTSETIDKLIEHIVHPLSQVCRLDVP